MTEYNVHTADLTEITERLVIHNELVLVKKVDSATTGGGKTYYTVNIANSKSRASIKIWDIFDLLKAGDFIVVDLRGQIHDKFGPQWKVVSYRKVEYAGDPEFDRLIFNPDVDTLYAEMTEYPYKNNTIRLLLGLFKDTFGESFKEKPGSISNHHSYPGGLVQHTHEVWKGAAALSELYAISAYPTVNTDIMLFGALIHDISKVEEYTELPDGSSTRNPVSSLNGNTSNGALMLGALVNELTHQGKLLDPVVVGILQHIVLSHHLKLEWGSPIIPLCLEAYFVAIADQISSKVANFTLGLEEDTEPNSPMTSRCYYWNNERVYKVPTIDPQFGKETKTLFSG